MHLIKTTLILCLTALSASTSFAETLSTSTVKTAQSPYYPKYPPTREADEGLTQKVKRGEYLAKMGDCISCHTDMEHHGAAYSGGFAIDTPFGRFFTPNITPDKETGIGRWTEADFVRALKEGKNPDGQNYFPVFPFVYFSNITEEDAKDMYAYFMNIPPVHQENKPLLFPFSVPGSRFSLLGWNLLFFYGNTPYAVDEKQSPAWNRGKYIVDGLGHCSMCHTPLNPLGAPKTQYYLTGGFIDGYWAPNITKEGLKSVSEQEIADQVFLHNRLINDAGPVAGPMAEVNHNSLMYMTPEDRLAIATYLKTVVSEEPMGLPPSEEEPSLSRGRQVYLKACIACHQDGRMTAPLIGDGPGWFSRLKSNGLQTLYKHAIDGFNSMPYRGACVTCSDNDIISAVDYLLNRSLSRSQWLDVLPQKQHQHAVEQKIREEDA
jgi:cytochrome c5